MKKFSDLKDCIKRNQREYYLTEMVGEKWYKRAFYYTLCFVAVFISEVRSLRLFTRVASGTYTTMLALIPFMVVGGSLILTFNQSADIGVLMERISEFAMPVVGESNKIGDFITTVLERTKTIGMGPVGLISLLVTTVMLFVHIEDCFNDIWHVAKPRAFFLRILLFYAIVTLGPLLISYSIFQAAEYVPSGFTQNVYWKYIRETLILALLCFVVFKFLPNTRVSLKSAFVPAAFASIVLEVGKSAFGFYMKFAFTQNEHSNYNLLYGALGIIPVTLLWLYLTWMMILFGVEIGYCMQNMRSLRLRMCYDTRKGDGDTWIFIGAYSALEVLASLVRNLCAARQPMNAEEIAVDCIYPVPAVEAILGRLENINVVKKIESEFSSTYILAKPLDSIVICEVMKTFDESSPRVKKHPKLEALVTQLIAAQEQIWTSSNANILREDGVALKDVGSDPTVDNLHLDEQDS